MPSKLTVLMYHALSDARGRCRDADPHYAVTRPTLRRHLGAVRAAGLRPASVAGVLRTGECAGKVAFTFDDGHESNAAAALDILEVGGSADFFVNPAAVGRRGFLDWLALRDLASAGISIQSHGYSHRYLDEVTGPELAHELSASKALIEDRLGHPVWLLAPPGGRLPRQAVSLARQFGYRGICSSRVGFWVSGGSAWNIPRLAVLASTGDAQFGRWLGQDGWEMARLRARHHLLVAAKRVLGNRHYDRLRSQLLGGRYQPGRP